MPFVAGSTALSSWRHGASRCVGGRRRARRAHLHRASDPRARATARSTPKANTPCRSPAVPSRLLRRCRARTSRPRVVPPAVSSRASRRRAPSRAPRRRAHAPRRRGRRLRVARRVPRMGRRRGRRARRPRHDRHQRRRVAALPNRRRRARGGSPRPAEGRLARAHHGPPRVNPEGTRGPLPTASSSPPPLRATRGSSRKAQIIPSLARAPRARTLTLRAFASHPVPSPTDPSPPVPPSRDSRVSTAPSRASTCRTPTATPSSRSPSW